MTNGGGGAKPAVFSKWRSSASRTGKDELGGFFCGDARGATRVQGHEVAAIKYLSRPKTLIWNNSWSRQVHDERAIKRFMPLALIPTALFVSGPGYARYLDFLPITALRLVHYVVPRIPAFSRIASNLLKLLVKVFRPRY